MSNLDSTPNHTSLTYRGLHFGGVGLTLVYLNVVPMKSYEAHDDMSLDVNQSGRKPLSAKWLKLNVAKPFVFVKIFVKTNVKKITW